MLIIMCYLIGVAGTVKMLIKSDVRHGNIYLNQYKNCFKYFKLVFISAVLPLRIHKHLYVGGT